MQLQLATWPEVEAYLEKSTGIIVPIGSTEQHGPNGLIGTDAITSEVIAARVGEAENAMVAPTIAVGMAQHHMAFKGSVTFRPSTLISVIRDIVVSLARHGFDRFLFINGHGGNIPTVGAAFAQIYTELAEARAMAGSGGNRMPDSVQCRLENWFLHPDVAALAKTLYGDKEGFHATPSEVAVTWYAYPDQQRDVPLGPISMARQRYHDFEDYRRRHPDGRIASDPSLATPEDGKRIVDTAAAAMAGVYRDFVAGA